MTTRAQRHLTTLARSAGCTVLGIDHGTHYKVRVEAPDGRQGLVVCGKTPSDHRAQKNQLARFRKFAKGVTQ